jgi:uncharacterized protein DUF1565
MRLASLLGSALVLCGAVSRASAVDIWVDAATGNDANPGTLPLPLLSITAAATIAAPGDRILVRPGTYDPGTTGEIFPINIGLPGGVAVPQQNVQILGVGGAAATIVDGAGASTSVAGMISFRAMGSGGRLSGFTLRNHNGGFGVVRIGSITAGSSFQTTNIEIDHCVVETGAGFSAYGIATFGPAGGLRIHDNLIQGATDANLWISDITTGSPGGGDVYNNTIVDGLNGIRVQGGNWNVFNNIVANHSNFGIFDFGIAPPALLNLLNDSNCVFGNATDYSAIAPGPNDVSVDPLFVNPVPPGDHHLLATSPLVDAGTSIVPPFVDSDGDGDPRFIDSDNDAFAVPEIGYDEVTDVRLLLNGTFGQGQTFSLDVAAPAGRFVAYFFSLGPLNFVLQPFGNVLIDPTILIQFFPSGITPAAATPPIPIPVLPVLDGSFVHMQAAVFDVASPPLAKVTNKIVGAL